LWLRTRRSGVRISQGAPFSPINTRVFEEAGKPVRPGVAKSYRHLTLPGRDRPWQGVPIAKSGHPTRRSPPGILARSDVKISPMKRVSGPNRFPPELHALLKNYVYVYLDPKTSRPFYVGRGKGNRAFAHLSDSCEGAKNRMIATIRARGQEPKIDLLCYGLSDKNAALVEAAAIGLLGRPPLLNLVAGDSTMGQQRISAKELIRFQSARPIHVKENALLIRINQLYRSDMTPLELYEATRGVWKLGLRRYKAQFAFAVFQGVVLEVYRIDRWLPAGYSKYTTRECEFSRGRWEFEGTIDKKLSRRYVGRSVRTYFPKHSQFPTVYVVN